MKDRGTICQCREGFIGDGHVCEGKNNNLFVCVCLLHPLLFIAIPSHEGNFLFASLGMIINKVGFDATKSNPGYPIVTSGKTATGLDIDCLKGKVSNS